MVQGEKSESSEVASSPGQTFERLIKDTDILKSASIYQEGEKLCRCL
jgi:hypothetical protein